MTFMTQTNDAALHAAYLQAGMLAMHSYFDQHIVRTDDGCCWVVDEGSYETLIADMGEQIIVTIPAGRSDES